MRSDLARNLEIESYERGAETIGKLVNKKEERRVDSLAETFEFVLHFAKHWVQLQVTSREYGHEDWILKRVGCHLLVDFDKNKEKHSWQYL